MGRVGFIGSGDRRVCRASRASSFYSTVIRSSPKE